MRFVTFVHPYSPLFLALLLSWTLQPAKAALTTEFFLANGLNFTCTVLNHTFENAEISKNIMLLHGFPMFRVWWDPLLNLWNDYLESGDNSASVRAVACDLRGYSPGASPDGVENYDYDIFASDAFALAEAAGFNAGFDLLGHDHGAALAWYMVDNDPNAFIQTLTTLSVPHIGLMSDALCGDKVDEEQVIASNYFNQFSLVDSATANNASLTELFQAFGIGPALQPESFQKMLWWYNGSLAEYFSLPRVVSDDEVAAYVQKAGPEAGAFINAIRQAVPLEVRDCIPTPEENVVGAVTIPTLFICGLSDTFLLCNSTYFSDYPPDILPDYEHVNFECGHDFFLPDNCISMDESQRVMEKITSFVLPTLLQIGDSDNEGATKEPPTAVSEYSASPKVARFIRTISVVGMIAVAVIMI
jgi:pimeloyl-ACP methyl ester carboxylesterase